MSKPKILKLPTAVTDTFNATIYIGHRVKYQRYQDDDYTETKMKSVVHDMVNSLKVCVSIQNVEFTYPDVLTYYGDVTEPGLAITIINYPKFPKQKEDILKLAETIGISLMTQFKQRGFSIVCTDKTYYYSNPLKE